jgi:hypothetical protein
MKFDATITLGVVIQTAIFLTTIVIAVTKVGARLARIETQIEPLWLQLCHRRGERGASEDGA